MDIQSSFEPCGLSSDCGSQESVIVPGFYFSGSTVDTSVVSTFASLAVGEMQCGSLVELDGFQAFFGIDTQLGSMELMSFSSGFELSAYALASFVKGFTVRLYANSGYALIFECPLDPDFVLSFGNKAYLFGDPDSPDAGNFFGETSICDAFAFLGWQFFSEFSRIDLAAEEFQSLRFGVPVVFGKFTSGITSSCSFASPALEAVLPSSLIDVEFCSADVKGQIRTSCNRLDLDFGPLVINASARKEKSSFGSMRFRAINRTLHAVIG